MSVLTISTDMDSFSRIYSGNQKEEYREIKPYYTSRMKKGFPFTMGLQIPKQSEGLKEVLIKVGVSSKSPSMIAKCLLTIDGGQEEWGAVPGEFYYVLKIEEIVSVSNIEKLEVMNKQEDPNKQEDSNAKDIDSEDMNSED